MMKTETDYKFKFKKGQRVKLKLDCADVYMRAWGGAEGFVGGNKMDDTGYYPMIYIVWDRNHWRENGEQNLWTFESHFEPVEKNSMASKNDDFLSELAALVERHRDGTPEPAEPEETVIEDRPAIEDQAQDSEHLEDLRSYMLNLRSATEFAKECEAFMLVGVNRQPNPTDPTSTILIPEIFAEYLTEESGLLLESQLSQIAAGAHTEAAAILIQQILEDRRDSDANGNPE